MLFTGKYSKPNNIIPGILIHQKFTKTHHFFIKLISFLNKNTDSANEPVPQLPDWVTEFQELAHS
jgi:hypothetical protein